MSSRGARPRGSGACSLVLVLMFLPMVAACAPSAGPAAGSRDARAGSGQDVPVRVSDDLAGAVAAGVVAEANRVRADAGMGALSVDPALTRAALGHAREMAALRRLDHASRTAGRETMTKRIEAAGGTWSAAAENLAMVPGSAGAAAGETVRLWLGSRGHRTNLLNSRYTHTGAAAAADGRGYWYVVQLYTVP